MGVRSSDTRVELYNHQQLPILEPSILLTRISEHPSTFPESQDSGAFAVPVDVLLPELPPTTDPDLPMGAGKKSWWAAVVEKLLLNHNKDKRTNGSIADCVGKGT